MCRPLRHRSMQMDPPSVLADIACDTGQPSLPVRTVHARCSRSFALITTGDRTDRMAARRGRCRHAAGTLARNVAGCAHPAKRYSTAPALIITRAAASPASGRGCVHRPRASPAGRAAKTGGRSVLPPRVSVRRTRRLRRCSRLLQARADMVPRADPGTTRGRLWRVQLPTRPPPFLVITIVADRGRAVAPPAP